MLLQRYRTAGERFASLVHTVRATGSEMRNVVPRPTSLSIRISPPMARMIPWEMKSPRPVRDLTVFTRGHRPPSGVPLPAHGGHAVPPLHQPSADVAPSPPTMRDLMTATTSSGPLMGKAPSE